MKSWKEELAEIDRLTPTEAAERLRERITYSEGLASDDPDWSVYPLMDRAADLLESVTRTLKESDHVLARLIASCPQCSTLGDDPNCTATVHTLPKEARDDIYRARDKNRPLLKDA